MESDQSLIVINADDFGWTPPINQAILYCFNRGLCSSATLMANMPGFEEACDLVHQEKLANHVGLHLVLREGFPLTEPIKRVPAFCDSNGRLSRLTLRPVMSLSSQEKRALAEEIRAQITRCRNVGHVPLTHVDSHCHLHNNFTVASVLLTVMAEQGLTCLRISRNCGPINGMGRRLYKNLFNAWLRRKGVAATKYFGSVADILDSFNRNKQSGSKASVEIMIHPMLDREGRVVDRHAQYDVGDLVKKITGYDQAVSFAGCKYP